MSATVDVERAGYDTLRRQMDRIERHQETVKKLQRIEAEAWALYALVHDLSGRSVESLSPEMRLLVKRANALVARIEGIA